MRAHMREHAYDCTKEDRYESTQESTCKSTHVGMCRNPRSNVDMRQPSVQQGIEWGY